MHTVSYRRDIVFSQAVSMMSLGNSVHFPGIICYCCRQYNSNYYVPFLCIIFTRNRLISVASRNPNDCTLQAFGFVWLVEKAGCFAPIKSLAVKVVSEMSYNASSMALNQTQLNWDCLCNGCLIQLCILAELPAVSMPDVS